MSSRSSPTSAGAIQDSGEIPPPQPMRQLGGVALVVLDPPGVPVQAQRVHQMHPGAVDRQQIRRPIPPAGGFQRHLGVRARLGQLQAKATGSLTIRTTSSTSPSPVIRTITNRRRCRSIPTYCC
jgi:hypothetical protein